MNQTEKHPISGVCVITDTVVQSCWTHLQLAELAMRGGARLIQLRDKTLPTRELFAIAVALRTLTLAFGARLIINDRVDIALAADADGVHLGQTDLPIPAARKILGEGKLIGGTASTLEEAVAVEKDGADYIGFGHIFPTTSKEKPSPPKGLEMLRQVVRAVRIPVIAIGGITAENAREVIKAGAAGIAVISAVAKAASPEAATKELVRLFELNQEQNALKIAELPQKR
ncbi:MAG: thiamine phosphate synthase [Chloroherpetonaceae bacterium]|nr:thiamine phosphate synthase [Chloroherpetonaceae bacterium]MCS7211993.1 thiamine phosphate synthase [Chloroherpetonaceae bacterium]MDW8020315.1 thiamine phosphate synthase [Chloroherpetonaceae bacterium]MDW8466489.1 thiamine phosphate synthase [Chloroherpetonaceae bacterium]